VFVPSDAAFAAAGGAGNVNLANHIIPNFLGVTPNLKDGLELTTQAGTTVTVSVKGGEIFLGSARILANDVITSNGAIQVIDKVRMTSLYLLIYRFIVLLSLCTPPWPLSSSEKQFYLYVQENVLILTRNGDAGPHAGYASVRGWRGGEQTLNICNDVEYHHLLRFCKVHDVIRRILVVY